MCGVADRAAEHGPHSAALRFNSKHAASKARPILSGAPAAAYTHVVRALGDRAGALFDLARRSRSAPCSAGAASRALHGAIAGACDVAARRAGARRRAVRAESNDARARAGARRCAAGAALEVTGAGPGALQVAVGGALDLAGPDGWTDARCPRALDDVGPGGLLAARNHQHSDRAYLQAPYECLALGRPRGVVVPVWCPIEVLAFVHVAPLNDGRVPSLTSSVSHSHSRYNLVFRLFWSQRPAIS